MVNWLFQYFRRYLSSLTPLLPTPETSCFYNDSFILQEAYIVNIILFLITDCTNHQIYCSFDNLSTVELNELTNKKTMEFTISYLWKRSDQLGMVISKRIKSTKKLIQENKLMQKNGDVSVFFYGSLFIKSS